MITRIQVLFLLSVLGLCSWAQTEEAENDSPLFGMPLPTSRLSTGEVRKLLESGVNRKRLRREINSIPMSRVGPGYMLFFLKDGTLRIPLFTRGTEQVTSWTLTRADGTKIQSGTAR